MALTQRVVEHAARKAGGLWLLSWPLLAALLTYVYLLSHGAYMLRDGDTHWQVATGRWIVYNGVIPDADPFSRTMLGSAWTAHEWLSDVAMFWAYHWGGWTFVAALTAFAFASSIALLTRALLRWLEPVYALLFVALGVSMAVVHALARPHLLAMPLMMAWMVELVVARDEDRRPGLWLLPLMTIWANAHGGFTFGLVLAFAFAAEAALKAFGKRAKFAAVLQSWGWFLLLAVAASLITPHGTQGLWFSWQMLTKSSYAPSVVGEWQSPSFHLFQSMEIWLFAGLAMVLHQGLRLPAMRIVLLLGLLHMALKHARYIELVGLLAPLVIAAPFGAQWRQRRRNKPQFERADPLLAKLSVPAGSLAVIGATVVIAAIPAWMAYAKPLKFDGAVSPVRAIETAKAARIRGPVFNSYESGGYLAFLGIPPFIDARADTYGDAFLRQYREALLLSNSNGLVTLLDKHKVTWTLLAPGTAAIALLDVLPEWKRIYADDAAVVHVRQPIDAGVQSRP
jgi:hypothetical protein